MSRSPEDSTGDRTADAPPCDRAGVSDSLDAVFEVLAARRRRCALYVLTRESGSISRADLSAAVAALEGADRERVAASLAHVHLPKLAEHGAVHYDPRRGTVRLADRIDRFDPYLAVAAEHERPPVRRALDETGGSGS